mmetsp:Transcript_20181/g.37625  ORF Transcript_20181/g.37625 Transcript_20181/m.37625 type:complete len:2913 (-) Transcript_20181:48-8786(-)
MDFVFGGSLASGDVPLLEFDFSELFGKESGGNPTYLLERVVNARSNLYWLSIPSEFFRTEETTTQLTVKVDGQPAICKGNCAFSYLEPSPTITSVKDNNSTITLEGFNLISNTDFVKVTVGGVDCKVLQASETSIVCEKAVGVAGTHVPQVFFAGKGNAVIEPNAGTVSFDLAVTDVAPEYGAKSGGTLLTVTGRGFQTTPALPGIPYTVTMSGKKCTIRSSSPTKLKCLLQESSTQRPPILMVQVGNLSANNQDFEYNSNLSPVIEGLLPKPTEASTVEPTEVTIIGKRFDSIIPDQLPNVFVGDFECYVTKANATHVICNLHGGEAGTYDLVLTVPGRGNADKINFKLRFDITKITPQVGSVHGGTLLSIEGFGFSKVPSNSVVWFDDDTYCNIEGTSSNSLIKCRTPPQGQQQPATRKVSVLGRIQEEAECINSCTFNYSSTATPIVASLNSSSGAAGNTLEIIGNGFGQNMTTVHVSIGTEARLIQVLNEKIVVVLNAIEAGTYDVEVLVDNLGLAFSNQTFAIELDVLSVSPNRISQAGGEVSIVGSGFSNQASVKFGSAACSISYSNLTYIGCRLGAYTTDDKSNALKITQGSASYLCSNLTNCGISFTLASTPKVSNAILSGSILTVSGTGFSSEVDQMKITTGGVDCKVLTASPTSVTCTEVIAKGSQLVQVHVQGKGFATGTSTVVGEFDVSGVSLNSSFAGNSTVILTGKGLSPQTLVTVCGLPCDVISSNFTSLKCSSPKLATRYSQANYPVYPEAMFLTTGLSASSAVAGNGLEKALDDNYTTYFEAPQCNVTLDSGVQRKVELSGFLFAASNLANLKGSEFKGSDDGSTWSTLYTFNFVNDGWNYWHPSSPTAYRFYRFTKPSSCSLVEIKFYGVSFLDSSSSAESCPIKVSNSSSVFELGSVEYSTAHTPVVSRVSPKYASVLGGTDLNFYGLYLQDVVAVTLDGVNCPIVNHNSTVVSCKTGPKIDFNASGLAILSKTGLAVTTGVSVLYGDKWSSKTTWNGEVPPKDGETVHIPKGMTIFLDIPTAKLELLNIEGSLVALDEADLSIDAKWVFIKEGKLQVGSEKEPFTHQFNLTLHGDRSTPQIPLFGNKALVNLGGTLELNGKNRLRTWTCLERTVEAGSSTLVIRDEVDWTVGEVIVVASTSFESSDAEVRTISARNGREITVSEVFKRSHYAATEVYDDKTMEVRAEVGLLSRNIRVRGSEQGLDQDHGVILFSSSGVGLEAVTRIAYVEVSNSGQVNSPDRFSINLWYKCNASKSFVKGCSIHNSFSRGILIKADNLRVSNNVLYNIKGHAIYLHHSSHTGNTIDSNLIVEVRRTYSLMRSDITPAGILVKHPGSFISNNHIAGSQGYGIWYDLPERVKEYGYHYDHCPIGEDLGLFANNTAHSIQFNGLHISPGHIPSTKLCEPKPYITIFEVLPPPITAVYQNFTAYKCKVNGAYGSKIGDVRWVNFKVADSMNAGLEMTWTDYSKVWETVAIIDALLVGTSNNSLADSDSLKGSKGIVTPPRDGFRIEGAAFHNFSAFQNPLEESRVYDMGARMVKLSKLRFFNSHRRIAWSWPYRGFYEVLDDSLTGTVGAYVAANMPHLVNEHCKLNNETYNSIVCDGTRPIRKVIIYGYDAELQVRMGNVSMPDSFYPPNSISRAFYIFAGWYSYGLALPLVCGYEYSFSPNSASRDWIRFDIDFQHLIQIDEWAHLHFKFLGIKDTLTVKRGSHSVALSQGPLSPLMESGSYRFDNETLKELEVMLNGNNSGGEDTNKRLYIEGYRQFLPKTEPPTPEPTKPISKLKWSDPQSWPNGSVPVDGERVKILESWDMLLDISTATLNHLEVNGNLTFEAAKNITLSSYTIHVRQGGIFSGTQKSPLMPQVLHEIVLHGNVSSQVYALASDFDVGNKALVVTGKLNLYGAPREVWRRLVQNALPGEKAIFVEEGQWRVGDQIVLASSSFTMDETETATIIGVESQSDDETWRAKESKRKYGLYSSEVYPHTTATQDPIKAMKLTLDKPLSFYHSGSSISARGKVVEMRAEVGLLSSNIRIRGTDNGWQCSIIVTDYTNSTASSQPVTLSGTVNLANVEVSNCGVPNGARAALRFYNSKSQSTVTNSIIKGSQNIALEIHKSQNVALKGNLIFNAIRAGVSVKDSSQIVLDNNLAVLISFVGSNERAIKPTAFLICPEDYSTSCASITLTNNVAAGYRLAGFAYKLGCSSGNSAFNNSAHSGPIGVIVQGCNEVESFTAYFNSEVGVLGSQSASQVQFKDIKSVENSLGFIANIESSSSTNTAFISNSVFIGQTVHSASCNSRYGVGTGSFGMIFRSSTELASPVYAFRSDAAFGGEFKYSDVHFESFYSNSTCSSSQAAIVSSSFNADFINPQIFSRTTFTNVDKDARFYVNDTNPAHSKEELCGYFPCTASQNLLIRDTDGSLMESGLRTYFLSNNSGVALKEGCSLSSKARGFVCINTPLKEFDYGVLAFESSDMDRYQRTLAPVNVTSDEFILSSANGRFFNKLNSFINHEYSGNRRLSRFVSVVPMNRYLNLTAKGTWPQKMGFQLVGVEDLNQAVVVTMQYQQPYTIALYNHGVKQKALEYSNSAFNRVTLTSPAGSNFWYFTDKKIQFVIKAGDSIELRAVDSIQLSVKMEMTTEEFFASNGVTQFIDRLAAVLGIPTYRIRVTQVKRGSTIVEAVVEADSEGNPDAETSKEELTSLKTQLEEKVKKGTVELNAPILSMEVQVVTVNETLTPDSPDSPTNPSPPSSPNPAPPSSPQSSPSPPSDSPSTTSSPSPSSNDSDDSVPSGNEGSSGESSEEPTEDSDEKSYEELNEESDEESDGEEGIPKWAIALGACGCFIVLSLVVALVVIFLKRKLRKRISPALEPSSDRKRLSTGLDGEVASPLKITLELQD